MERKFYHKKRWWITLSLAMMIVMMVVFRIQVLTAIGNYLVADDPNYESPVFAVLGGNSAERGRAAVWLAQQYPKAHFLVTGGNMPSQLAAVGIVTTEACLTRDCMVHLGVNPNRISILEEGTSSKEEADLLLEYCQRHQIKQITIVSGQYHLRRLRRTFEPNFKAHHIDIKFFGAFEQGFHPDDWWTNESGMIYTTNEYIKILYYWLKY